MKRMLAICFLFMLSFVIANAQPNNIEHCPAFSYAGNRHEWKKPFITTGESERKVFFQNTKFVRIEDWCITTDGESIPPTRVQLLWQYRDVPSIDERTPVSYQAHLGFSSMELVNIVPVSVFETLPDFGAFSILKIKFYGKEILVALFPSPVEKAAYFQGTDGLLYKVTELP